MLEAKNHFNCTEFDDFPIEEAYLNDIVVRDNKVRICYLLDGEPVEYSIEYDSISLEDPILGSPLQVKCWSVALAVMYSLSLGCVLPQRVDFSKYSSFIDREFLDFVQLLMTKCWSENRYQLGKLEYQKPEIAIDEARLGQAVNYPLFELTAERGTVDAIIGSGSGKDSLLCSLILQNAAIDYDVLTCLYDLYGNLEEQKQLFTQANQHLQYRKQHYVYLQEFYHHWLDKRVEKSQIIPRTQAYFPEKKRFRTSVSEAVILPFIVAPIQAVHKIPLLLLGNEKSANAPNLIDSGEEVAHQWPKSLAANQKVQQQMARMFANINQSSLISSIHDVRIIDLLFQLGDRLPYATNSCNVQKPWCCRCEKCCYVFASFCAYGDREKTIAAFGNDLFEMEENLHIWAELLGLKGYIPWECVGMPEETQLYFYRLYQQGLRNKAIALFEQEVLLPLQMGGVRVDRHFQDIQNRFARVYDDYHTLPQSLWEKVSPILQGNSHP
ncbi:hypothetical protein [Roseofilum casamattae]|uniref:UDP-N-acetyl-alpha-D-muramoyl-L-alanyl-L-glutamate epimerase n=1 Tax=Roseofilum casamattae BLCC-M143 TaxID=3022442 RepID=A0ABT7C2S1_9CYAN|nr:hypothetical protein [Roseofilum casamattae]MDJ1185756.1 hypothetical protein [Roseofilum casamattae BLCC-M143]